LLFLQLKFEKNLMHNYLVDTHCHLDLIEEKGISLNEILKNCQNNNVKILQNICTRFSKFEKILSYTIDNQDIYCSIGLHPCYVSNDEYKTAEQIIALCKIHKKIIGIGETGLDYFHDLSQIDLQKKSFISHIVASSQTKLPTIIHARNADKDMAEILYSEQKNQQFPALLHCFSSSRELCFKALDLGIYISIAGIVTFNNAKDLQEIVKAIPLEYLLLETDSPYLAPTPFRGNTNQPSFTLHVAEFIAKIKNISLEKITEQTTKNFHRLFNI
jgi:TatD DNase family protein